MTRVRAQRIGGGVAIGYAVAASLWIVFSDRLVEALGLEYTLVQTYKGLGFVVVTAVALYLVVAFWVDKTVASLERVDTVEERYQALFEANPLPTFLFAQADLRFLAVNEATVRQYGYTAEELLGMTIEAIRPPEDVPALHEVLQDIPGHGDRIGVMRHRTKAGETLLVEIYRHPVRWHETDAVLVVANDVTARMEAEQAELRASRRLAAIVDTSPFAVILLDLDGNVTVWNAAAEKIFGWSAEEVLGRPNPIVPPEAANDFRRTFEHVLATNSLYVDEVVRCRKDEGRVDVRLYTTVALGPDGEPEGAYALIEDITDRKRSEAELVRYRDQLQDLVEERTRELHAVNERLQRATKIKSEFLANMSHELRTPLNSIIGFSGVLLQGLAGDLSEEQAKQVSMVYRSGRHLLDLINDILDLSRIEAGRTVVEPIGFDARELVDSVASSLAPQAAEKRIGLEVVGVPGRVDAFTDRTKVKQILLNLVGNAIKFTDEGRVEIEIDPNAAEDELVIVVSDTGRGIPEADIPAIFDEFTQATRRAEEKPAGTGLGLAISRRLARMLGGDVHVKSTLGSGSFFTLRIPVRYARSTTPEPLVAENEEIAGPGR